MSTSQLIRVLEAMIVSHVGQRGGGASKCGEENGVGVQRVKTLWRRVRVMLALTKNGGAERTEASKLPFNSIHLGRKRNFSIPVTDP